MREIKVPFRGAGCDQVFEQNRRGRDFLQSHSPEGCQVEASRGRLLPTLPDTTLTIEW